MRALIPPRLDRAIVSDCWNQIGVHGDRSCPELPQHIHCRNCPVYGRGGRRAARWRCPVTYLAEWTSHFSRPKAAEDIAIRSVVIFRVASEWFALPTSVVMEVANVLPFTRCRTGQTVQCSAWPACAGNYSSACRSVRSLVWNHREPRAGTAAAPCISACW